jgi:MYXO-CTERM domain-containing protein
MTSQKRNIGPIGIAAIITASTIAASIAQADIIAYDIVWNNVSGTAATAVGTMTLDTSLSVSGFYGWNDPANPIIDISITIADSLVGDGFGNFNSGDGTYGYGAGDINAINWYVGALDYNAELMAQGTVDGFSFYGSGITGGFGAHSFVIWNTNEAFHVASITPSVPSPGFFSLLGLGGLVGVRRRR